MNAMIDIDDSETPDIALVKEALADSERLGKPFLDLLGEKCGGVGADATAVLARSLEYPLFDAQALYVAEPAFDLVSAPHAAQKRCAMVRANGRLTAVIVDPFDYELRQWLEMQARQPVEWAVASAADLAAFVARHEKDLRAIDGAVKEAQRDGDVGGAVENLSLTTISASASPIVKLVQSTVYDALRSGASDIHLEATTSGLTVRYRIDGVLAEIAAVGGVGVAEQVISRLKVMSELDIAERRVPQDGRFKLAIDGRPIDFRVSIMPSVHGEDAVLRVLDKQALTLTMQGLSLEALGFPSDVVQQIRGLSSLPYGMLLVTGPTGSGKTTTLYAAITETHCATDKFVTIEDPVEYQLPGVLQIPVNEKKGLTFARGLRSILRHDPDKIMVGEIRDLETAQIAIQSALTGHLVFTTVHANNVFDVVSRFIHMGVDTYGFVSALNGVLAQRLVRLACGQCAETRYASPQFIRASLQAGLPEPYEEVAAGKGCVHCRGTGYRGRKAVGELMQLNDELREAIVARMPARQLKELAYKSGVKLIRARALELVSQGETTLEEVNRVTISA